MKKKNQTAEAAANIVLLCIRALQLFFQLPTVLFGMRLAGNTEQGESSV